MLLIVSLLGTYLIPAEYFLFLNSSIFLVQSLSLSAHAGYHRFAIYQVLRSGEIGTHDRLRVGDR
jgi:hypothetical protein